MPQLGPIAWTTLFIFIWSLLLLSFIMNWFSSKKSFDSSTTKSKTISTSPWSW